MRSGTMKWCMQRSRLLRSGQMYSSTCDLGGAWGDTVFSRIHWGADCPDSSSVRIRAVLINKDLMRPFGNNSRPRTRNLSSLAEYCRCVGTKWILVVPPLPF